ncbi:MAG: four helix bundle protein [Candidatus Tritonobacter lacicola]|nr:four helix bundle protein [Candidatus Tritonobacter lacicola]
MGTIKSFRELEIWKKGIELVKGIYKMTAGFPKSELYGLTSQMRRCAVSIPSNVAEGFRRRHPKEFKHFLNIALGSSAELETQLVIAKELGYLEGEREAYFIEVIDHIDRMIVSLWKKL